MPRRSRISWNSLDEAVPPRIASSSESANRWSSARASPGPPRQTWNCSVSFSLEQLRPDGDRPADGGCGSGQPPASGAMRERRSSHSASCSTLPAAASTIAVDVGSPVELVDVRRSAPIRYVCSPITGRPSGSASPNTAAAPGRAPGRRGVLVHRDLLEHDLALGVDVAPGRRAQHVAHHLERGGRWLSSTRACSSVYSFDVAAFSSPPSSSNVWAISSRVVKRSAPEQQVLDEVRDSALGGPLVARAGIDPAADRDRAHPVQVLGDHAHATRERRHAMHRCR